MTEPSKDDRTTPRMTWWETGEFVMWNQDGVTYHGRIVLGQADRRLPGGVVGIRLDDGRATYVEIESHLLHEDVEAKQGGRMGGW